MRDIQRAIQILAGGPIIITQRAEVLSIDSNRTCKVKLLDTEAEITANMQAVPGLSEGLYIKPTLNSKVLILWTDIHNAHIIFTSEIDQIELGGNQFGGIMKASETTEKLNALEQDLNSLKQIITAWVPVPSDGGAALKTAAATWAGQSLSLTEASQLVNDKIVHG